MNQETAPLLFDARRLLVYVEDLDRAVNYYRDVLGFKPLGGVAGTNFEFATSGAPLVLHHDGRAADSAAGPSWLRSELQVRPRNSRLDRDLQEPWRSGRSRSLGSVARLGGVYQRSGGQRITDLSGQGREPLNADPVHSCSQLHLDEGLLDGTVKVDGFDATFRSRGIRPTWLESAAGRGRGQVRGDRASDTGLSCPHRARNRKGTRRRCRFS